MDSKELQKFIRNFPGAVKRRSSNLKFLQSPPKDNFTVYTPSTVVRDMCKMLPDDVWKRPDWTFLNLMCKDGIFLEELFWILNDNLKSEIPNYFERVDHILTKQLFGLSPCYVPADIDDLDIFERTVNKELYGREMFRSYAENSRLLLYGAYRADHPKAYTNKFDNPYGNIWPMYKIVDGNVKDSFALAREKATKTLKDLTEGVDKDMKFNVVIGNPPYNKGMDLDFVKLGFDLCTDYCVMITPAKWQTAADDQRLASKTINYKEFREKLVPHMSKVVFYPDAGDVFDIGLKGGISYFVMDKDEHEKCTVINKMKNQPIFNSIEVRDIRGAETLLNIGNEINMALKNNRKFIFNSVNTNLKYWVVNSNKVIGAKGNCFLTDGTATVLSKSEIIERGNPINADVVFASDSEYECKSFISWIDTKLVRFLVLINLNKLGPVMTNDYFRFVPAPPSGKFDHIYTDEELYKAFNLPQKYIDVIEAVIKER